MQDKKETLLRANKYINWTNRSNYHCHWTSTYTDFIVIGEEWDIKGYSDWYCESELEFQRKVNETDGCVTGYTFSSFKLNSDENPRPKDPGIYFFKQGKGCRGKWHKYFTGHEDESCHYVGSYRDFIVIGEEEEWNVKSCRSEGYNRYVKESDGCVTDADSSYFRLDDERPTEDGFYFFEPNKNCRGEWHTRVNDTSVAVCYKVGNNHDYIVVGSEKWNVKGYSQAGCREWSYNKNVTQSNDCVTDTDLSYFRLNYDGE